jgi:hypothetical protein
MKTKRGAESNTIISEIDSDVNAISSVIENSPADDLGGTVSSTSEV